MATFQSVSIKISEKLAIQSRVEALKTVVRKSLASGGKFLFFDWRKQVAVNTITQSMNSQTHATTENNYTVLSIDPDEQMINSMESMLGINIISREQFMSNHERAANEADRQQNTELAELHRSYANSVNVATPEVQAELLNKMFVMLGGDWVKIGSFIANGVQFSDSSSTVTTRYIGSGAVMVNVDQMVGYNNIKLTTNRVRFVKSIGPFKIFLPTITTEAQAIRVLLEAVNNRNTHLALHSLMHGAGVNTTIMPGRKTALMTAAANCDASMVQLLLESGANTSIIDSLSRTASDYAELARCGDIARSISSVPLTSFNLEIVADDPRLQLKMINLEEAGTIHPSSGASSLITIQDTPGNKTFRLLIKALVMVDSATYNRAQSHYNGYPLIQQYSDAYGHMVRIYEITDVCRLSAEVLDVPGYVIRHLSFDKNNHALGLSEKYGSPTEFDPNTRFFDREYFGVGPRTAGFARF